jgi:hypothetical protein
MDLEALRRAVENAIESYRYVIPLQTVGNAWKPSKIKTELAAMRAALVVPYWVNVEQRDTFEQISAHKAPSIECVVVADDARGNLLAFDPIEDEFLLVQRYDGRLSTCGVRGDAVGCFMAR